MTRLPDPLARALRRAAAGEPLSESESYEAFSWILDGGAGEVPTASLLTALQLRGETAAELRGALRAIRDRMIRFETGEGPHLDTCGTGGDGGGTVNISTAAAIVAAACGYRLVKHGNRAASSPSGSSDVLAALGIETDVEPEVQARCLKELGIAFLFAPRYHPGLRGVAVVRRQLPFRTLFNLLGPLCNPATPGHQLIGVPDRPRSRLLAETLAAEPTIRRAVVVTGSDGLDEVTLGGATSFWVVEDGTITEGMWTPEDFGLSPVQRDALRVSGAEESARRIRAAFQGEAGPVRDIILANAAAAIWTVEPMPLREAVGRAAQAIDSAAVDRLLERWQDLSRRGA